MTADLERLTAHLLDAARKAGADSADALAVDGTSLSIDVLKGRLEHAERSEGIEVGLRVLIGRRQACVASSDVSDTAIARMAEQAVAMAREAPEDSSAGLADPGQLARTWDIAALDLDDPSPEPTPAELQDDACRAEAAALAVPGVSQSAERRRWLRPPPHPSCGDERIFRWLCPHPAIDLLRRDHRDRHGYGT